MVNKTFTTKKGFTYLNPAVPIDYDDKALVSKLEKHNPLFLLVHYREKNKKEEAINLLISQRATFVKIDAIKEIIKTYLYFKDFQGALDYLKQSEFGNVHIRYMEFVVRMKRVVEEEIDIPQPNPTAVDHESGIHGQEDEVLGRMVEFFTEGLKCKFDRSFFDILIVFLQTTHLWEFVDLLRDILKKTEDSVFTDEYIKKLKFSDIKFLYKSMPDKFRYLKIMVRNNPFIKKKYFFEYFGVVGLEREIVESVLSSCFRSWAFRIAQENNWISDSMKKIIDKHFSANGRYIELGGEPELIFDDGKGKIK